MSLITRPLPQKLRIEGVEYPIRWDHKTSLRIMAALEDEELVEAEHIAIALKLFYGDALPPDAGKAMNGMALFLSGGKKAEGSAKADKPHHSLSQDEGFIYSAFWQTHKVNLSEDKLHWYVFLQLLADLGEDTQFCKLISLRRSLASGKATPEERKFASKYPEIVHLKNNHRKAALSAEQERNLSAFEAAYFEGVKRQAKEVSDARTP